MYIKDFDYPYIEVRDLYCMQDIKDLCLFQGWDGNMDSDIVRDISLFWEAYWFWQLGCQG